MKIRLVEARDRADFARMRAALWPDEDPDGLATELDALLADPDKVTFVAECDNGRLCGFAEAGTRAFANGVDEQPCAFLEGWWVEEQMRRSGVGRSLIAAVEAWARVRGFTELGSDAVLDNVLGQEAHRAVGFEERERVVYFRKRL